MLNYDFVKHLTAFLKNHFFKSHILKSLFLKRIFEIANSNGLLLSHLRLVKRQKWSLFFINNIKIRKIRKKKKPKNQKLKNKKQNKSKQNWSLPPPTCHPQKNIWGWLDQP
jgi:hypothetical protein